MQDQAPGVALGVLGAVQDIAEETRDFRGPMLDLILAPEIPDLGEGQDMEICKEEVIEEVMEERVMDIEAEGEGL